MTFHLGQCTAYTQPKEQNNTKKEGQILFPKLERHQNFVFLNIHALISFWNTNYHLTIDSSCHPIKQP